MMTIEEKLDRLKRRGSRIRVLDLFAGCGGLSLGFHTAGCRIVTGVELDPWGSESHSRNFHSDAPPDEQQFHAQAKDITETEPDELLEALTDFDDEAGVDVLVGGPPCQAYARVGRAKLREVAQHPTAFKIDPRANLYLRYLDYVEELQPLCIVMENVPDVLNFGGHNIAEEMSDVLEERGYECQYTLLNSVYYGVPQMRERLFLMASVPGIAARLSFPQPTHHHRLPVGYTGSRSVALKSIKRDLFSHSRYLDPPAATEEAPKATTAREAISDLPAITLHLENKLKRGARRFTEMIPYPKRGAVGLYAKLMREWPGFGNQVGISDHVIRYLPRDYSLFRRMNHGDQYPEAYKHALRMLDEEIEARRGRGETVRVGSSAYKDLHRALVPPYDPGKFPNKWRKMEPDAPARTLMAHLGKDGYSHIHYDSRQARTISVREAARLQSFPDGFVFSGTMNPAFRQIGNAVPPLLAYAIARRVVRALKGRSVAGFPGGIDLRTAPETAGSR